MLNYREKVSEIAKKLYNDGLVAGTSGNVSFLDRENHKIYITPSNMDYKEMQETDIVVLDEDGNILEGDHKPSSEWRLHAEVYKHQKRVNSVVHTHSPYATGFAINHKEIPLILVEMLPFLGGDIPVAKFGLPGTDDVGINAAKVLEYRNAALLENHGVVAVGETVDQAYIRAVYTEDAAKAYHLASVVGEPICVPEDAADILRKRYNLKR